MGKLVMVCASGVVIEGGGSWDNAKCPYAIPKSLRPPTNISSAGSCLNGAYPTVMYVDSSGAISISNSGGTGHGGLARHSSLTYIAE